MSAANLTSWGRYPLHPQQGERIYWLDQSASSPSLHAEGGSTLAYGCGRSYGDACLAVSDRVLVMCGIDRFVRVDCKFGVWLLKQDSRWRSLSASPCPMAGFRPSPRGPSLSPSVARLPTTCTARTIT